MSNFKIVAHRGASGSAPENTFAAFEKAVESGVDAIEIDVHQTMDGKIVIIHDDTLDRTTNSSGSIYEKKYEELKNVDAGSWFDVNYSDETIPLFSDFLEFVKNKAGIIVEVKYGSQKYPGIENNVWSLLKSHNLVKTTVVSSSRVTILNTFRQLSQEINLGKILSPKELWRSLFQPDSLLYKQDIIKQVKEIHPHWSFVDAKFMKWANSLGLAVIPWTINKEMKIRVMIDRGVQGVITNFPEIAKRAQK